MTLSELVRSLSDHCQQQVEGRHVLAINDTSEINLQAHAGRLKPDKLGVVGNNKDMGFFITQRWSWMPSQAFPWASVMSNSGFENLVMRQKRTKLPEITD